LSAIATLDALMERVLDEEKRKHDILADTRRMSIYTDEEESTQEVLLNVDVPDGDGEEFVLGEHALGQMATDLGIPKRYFDRMKETDFGLFQTNVHHWLYHEPNRRMIRSRRSDGDELTARAWLSDRYRRLDNIEIATKLLPEFARLGTDVEFHNAAITDTKFYLRATFPSMEKAVKVGDPVRWGVQLRNSEVGAGQFDISNFVLRLACINGMVVTRVMSARHVGKRLGENLSDEAISADDKAFWLAARDELRASIDVTRFNEAMEVLTGTTEGAVIEAPIKATERLAKAFSLSETEQEAVLTQLASGGDFSRWGALNAVTAAAKTVPSFDRQVELEEMGWTLASLPEREWAKLAVAA
jgi:hypothetical protein